MSRGGGANEESEGEMNKGRFLLGSLMLVLGGIISVFSLFALLVGGCTVKLFGIEAGFLYDILIYVGLGVFLIIGGALFSFGTKMKDEPKNKEGMD